MPRAPKQRPLGGRRNLLKLLRGNTLASAALVLLGFIAICSLAAPLVSSQSRDKIDLTKQYQSPSIEHPFGTDDLGRDLFVRVMYGGRVSLGVGVMAMLIALFLGLVAGGLAGYYGGIVDTLIMRFVDLMLAVPVFFVILFLSSVIVPSILMICLIIGMTQWMEVARLVRGVVLSTRELEFIDAARALGVTDNMILVRHLFPHTTAPVLVAGTLGLAQAIIIESALSFLGFGIQPPTPSWGAMLQNAQGYLSTAPWIAIFPGLMICLTVISCYVLGDFLTNALNPIRRKIP
ncbi:MAG: ABC transporter permease subunit [Candidatus Latescibacteria bacterium]|nr:ABC transporter permease subunit [Candidatus Latescibacterota bacterium]NIO27262.1 ABC transporter permease subunit [Candidatus Latescibacterota bacterium]NIO54786.1 ABC transporter permease subunit [Candidatus Latescibacterota bacterium]NIT00869.1 ABC transporter permease subunit [Candidatus Latescibacterota bacterium]NIT37792.1 ABC transporter permease subunit [Candidatus Latescibacterota bacterium]